jgi:tetratricopeptide (TPR) repeat protein/DNA-binding CsgD family transcriptional regulator
MGSIVGQPLGRIECLQPPAGFDTFTLIKNMKKRIYLSLPVIFILSFSSCIKDTDDYGKLLYKAERCIIDKPDSALLYIGSIITPQLLNESDYAKYAVLLVQTHTQNNLSSLNDTIIYDAIRYYKKSNDEFNLAKVYLQAGRVAEDRKEYNNAKLYYNEAIGLAKKCNQTEIITISMLETASLSFWVGDYPDALTWFNLSLDYYPDDIEEQAIKKKIADCHFMMNHINVADSMYSDLESTIDAKNKDLLADIAKCKAQLLYKTGNYKPALNLMDKAISLSGKKELLSVFYLLKADMHKQLNQYDSAYHSQQKAIDYASGAKRLDFISMINNSQNKEKEYLKIPDNICWHIVIGLELNKSRYTTISTMESIYNTRKAQIRTQALVIENQRYVIIIITILLCFVIIQFILIQLRKCRIRKYRIKIENINEQFEIKEEKFNEKLNYIQTTLLDRLLLYRRLVVMSLFRNKRNSQFLMDVNRIIYNKEDGVIFDWAILNNILNTVYDNFQIKLSEKYVLILSDKEIEFLLLKKAGFETKEICDILNLTPTTIYHRGTDIRKKMNLEPTQDILDYLSRKLLKE